MKIGSALISKRASRIASRAALLATNDATTISALIVAIRAALRWSSSLATVLVVRALGGELVMQASGAVGQHQPDAGEDQVQPGERAKPEPEHLHQHEHKTKPRD